MNADPSEALSALVERARAAIAGIVPPVPSEPAVGEAAEGLVRAEVGVDGRLRVLDVDARMLRQPFEDVCAAVVDAVNAALDARPPGAGTGPLLAELKAVQEQSVQEMTKISHAFSDALNRVLHK